MPELVGYYTPMQYKAGSIIDPSSIDRATGEGQIRDFYYLRKALVEAQRKKIFSQLADTISMPKHYGKTIKQSVYVPLLDDRNINDQGIDATGNITANQVTITIINPDGMVFRAVGGGIDAATALIAARNSAVTIWKNMKQAVTSYAAQKTVLEGLGWQIIEGAAVPGSGNLYGSSRDVGTITAKLPLLSETSGRENRVGFTRYLIEGTIAKFGFYEEYTRDSEEFDSDEKLRQHISREAVNGAHQVTEDVLQIDIINNSGVVMYGGTALSTGMLHGNQPTPEQDPTNPDPACTLTYDLLMKTDIILDNNRCPKDTQVITGSKYTDTKTVAAARYAYIPSELLPTLHKMKDYHGDKAFVPIQHYQAGNHIAEGEVGSIGHFRFIVVPDMKYWEGAGAIASNNKGFRTTDNGISENYNVYPILIIGDKSFSTIGFQSNGNMFRFEIIHKKPGADTASSMDVYGNRGFWSIQWWYGFLAMRPERIALLKVVAEM